MQSADCKCQFNNLHTSVENIFGSKSGVCFEISCMPSNINFPKPRQKHEIRQCSKM